MNTNHLSRKVHILRDSVAQKIAAGEVIERPLSVVRELLDNAIDSGADKIDVYLENGGIDSISVVDNGSGMTEEDLVLCFRPHATSKIIDVDDLQKLNTLGFRGEALNSIAASACLSIISKKADGNGYKLTVSDGLTANLEVSQAKDGSTVNVKNLFHTIPARKKFLKTARGETSSAKQIFIEKALPFPEIEFRLFVDGKINIVLQKSDLRSRILAIYSHIFQAPLLESQSFSSSYCDIEAVLSEPALYRNDKRYIYCFVNKRRVYEYALIQAVEYAYRHHLPGGRFPYAFLFLEINPESVDFNIHPAKREVKIKTLHEVHRNVVDMCHQFLAKQNSSQAFSHSVSETISNFQSSLDYSVKESISNDSQNPRSEEIKNNSKTLNILEKEQFNSTLENKQFEDTNHDFFYLGQVFNVFLLVKKNQAIYIIDQHAAHERILYNQFCKDSSRQKLLIPHELPFEFELEHAKSLITELQYLGYEIELEKNKFIIKEVPAHSSRFIQQISDFLVNFKGDSKNLQQRLLAHLACKAAIKDGEVLDRYTAIQLINETFALKVPRCPHGRPVWFELTKNELFQLLGRIV